MKLITSTNSYKCFVGLLVTLALSWFPASVRSTPRSLRDLDFLNFAYPWPRTLARRNARVGRIVLRNGEMAEKSGGAEPDSPPGDAGASLRSLTYADVTGDGREEALVVINVPVCCHGWGINCVYVYGWRGGRPMLLLSFSDGDRADGGLRDLYAGDGDLVVELWGKDSRVRHGTVTFDGRAFTPTCCATVYTRGRYRSVGGSFRLISAEVLPNPDPRSINDGYDHLVDPRGQGSQ